MSETAAQLLSAFSSLSEAEQHEVMIALLRQSGELPGSVMGGDQLVALAEEVFLSLEAEETSGTKDSQG
jgi:hypothetical protein